jgi:hypothetical protein
MDFEQTGWTPANRLIGIFDILGFSQLLDSIGVDGVTSRVKSIMEKLDSDFRWEARAITFSDTVFIYSARTFRDARHLHEIGRVHEERSAQGFLGYCASLVAESIQIGLPLRGGIAWGQCVIMPRRGAFIGEPIVAAYQTEQAQDWAGLAVHESALFLLDRSQSLHSLPVKYPVPWKPQRSGAEWTLDWPRTVSKPVAYRAMLRDVVAAHRGSEHEAKWLNTWRYFESRFALLRDHDPGTEDFPERHGFLAFSREC